MTDTAPWPPGTATGLGGMPGTDPVEAARVIVGELPDLPHLPELPARGAGADAIGRTGALLVDLALELVPSGYRVAAAPGREHRRAANLLRTDLDAFEEARGLAGTRSEVVKVQAAGPWTLAASVELASGHAVLTDRGALADFAASLAEGLRRQVDELSRRLDAAVVVALDETLLPTVLAGGVATPSGYGTVPAVPETDAVELLTGVLGELPAPRILRCDAVRPPLAVLHRTGAEALAVDADRIAGAPGTTVDALGEAWDAGMLVLLGLVPAEQPARLPCLEELARPALDLVDRLGLPRALLASHCVPTPAGGLDRSGPSWARRALVLCRELGQAFLDPPESW